MQHILYRLKEVLEEIAQIRLHILESIDLHSVGFLSAQHSKACKKKMKLKQALIECLVAKHSPATTNKYVARRSVSCPVLHDITRRRRQKVRRASI